jgi:pilus assembly protein Flp/PilA
MKVIAHIKAFLKDEEGASGIEYALIAAMVAAVIAPFVLSSDGIGSKVNAIFTGINTAMTKP